MLPEGASEMKDTEGTETAEDVKAGAGTGARATGDQTGKDVQGTPGQPSTQQSSVPSNPSGVVSGPPGPNLAASKPLATDPAPPEPVKTKSRGWLGYFTRKSTESSSAHSETTTKSEPAAPPETPASADVQPTAPQDNPELEVDSPTSPEPIDEAITPALEAALQTPAPPLTEGPSAPVSTGDAEPEKEAPRGMPSLPKRPPQTTGPSRPAGMGSGLPPRTAARPSGMGSGLPARTGVPRGAPVGGTVGGMPQPGRAPVQSPGRVPEELGDEPPAVREVREKLLHIRQTMLRAASRLGMRPGDILVQEFMSRVDTAERVKYARVTVRPPIDPLFQTALEMEQGHLNEGLGYDTTILVLGPIASGKTSLIQNILAEGPGLAPQFATTSTKSITTITGSVCGVKMTFIDTPGLRLAASMRRHNMLLLKSIKAAVNKYKPHIVIYVDRMDVLRREFSDLPLLRLINDMLPNMLYNCIAVLTHANAPPPDGAHGEMPYSEYYRLRLDAASQIISHGIQDMRWGGRPLGFENHPVCRTAEDVPVLPNGVPFKRNTIAQIITSRLFREAENILQITRSKNRIKDVLSLIGPRKQLQLSALVSQLLQSKPPKKFPEEERDLKTDDELRSLDEGEFAVEEQRKKDYVRLRRVEVLQEEAHPSQVPIVGQKIDLNPSFDHEVNQHRYNATDFVGGWSVRPIISSPDATYDHDEGIEMFQVAREGVVRARGQHIGGFPASMIIQVSKTKRPLSLTMESGLSYHQSKSIVTTAGCIIHPAGGEGELVYTPSLDIRVKPHENDKITLGLMATRLSEDGWPHKGQLSWGAKLENKLKVTDGAKVTIAGGGMTAKVSGNQFRGEGYMDQAYGGNMDVKLSGGKGEYDPSFIFGVGVSTQRRGNHTRTGYSGQVAMEVAITPETMLNGSINMTTGGSGSMSLRAASHDRPAWGWVMLLPLSMKLLKRVTGRDSDYL